MSAVLQGIGQTFGFMLPVGMLAVGLALLQSWAERKRK